MFVCVWICPYVCVCVCMYELLGCEAHARDEVCRQGTDGGHASSGGVSGSAAQGAASALGHVQPTGPSVPVSPHSYATAVAAVVCGGRSPPSVTVTIAAVAASAFVSQGPACRRCRRCQQCRHGQLMLPNAVSVAPSSPDLPMAAPPGGGCRTRRQYGRTSHAYSRNKKLLSMRADDVARRLRNRRQPLPTLAG